MSLEIRRLSLSISNKRKANAMNSYWLFGAVIILVLQSGISTGEAQDANTLEIIKQLQKRIDDLEKKVKSLEAGKPAETPGVDTPSKQRIEDLDQKVKILE